MILGIDEVGRGAWAGPLVVGAVVLGDANISGLTDSKLLTKKKRQNLAELIHAHAAGIGLGWVEPSEIDNIGLSAALRMATRRAIDEVRTQTSFHEIIIDGTINFLSETPLENYVSLLKKADLLIPSVSAASIVAKVARDDYMIEQAAFYDGYDMESHVGYGTARHRQAIEQHGVTPLHRLSIAPLAKYHQSSASPAKNQAVTSRQIGDVSESAAAIWLEKHGHKILERNWKTKWCEIDIVSQKDDGLYFTEVKHRKNNKSGDGFEAITSKKLRQMTFAAKFYVHYHHIVSADMRLMAIATSGDIADGELDVSNAVTID